MITSTHILYCDMLILYAELAPVGFTTYNLLSPGGTELKSTDNDVSLVAVNRRSVWRFVRVETEYTLVV